MKTPYDKQSTSPDHGLAAIGRVRSLSDDRRRAIVAMLDAAAGRVARLLVILVEHDGLAVEQAASVVGVAVARARELLGAAHRLSIMETRLDDRTAQLRRLFGLELVEQRKVQPRSKWKRKLHDGTTSGQSKAEASFDAAS